MSGFKSSIIIEPFRVKSVEPLHLLSSEERLQALDRATFNLFKLRSSEVLIDLLTDSGTSAMSSEQWAALQRGDESYAGSESFEELEQRVQELTGMPYVIPVHQGRAAEHLLFQFLARRITPGVIPNNSHFDTTRANAEAQAFEALDLPCRESEDLRSDFPFKGNMDLDRLEDFLAKTDRRRIPVGMLTITNNTLGGQPVSFSNIEKVSQLYRKHGIPFFLDACRFAENVAFIKKHERPHDSAESIAREIFRLADGVSFSAKKDAFANIGGFLALRDAAWAEELRTDLILTEGFPTYGGLAGRDLAAIAQGLKEVLDENYLKYRIAVMSYMGGFLDRQGIPWLRPAGGHAIYLDAQSFASHLRWNEYPGQSLAIALYREAGIRSCEIGSVMFGRRTDGSEAAHRFELVRLAIPRRVYTQSHIDYVLQAIEYVYSNRRELKPVRIVKEPQRLRHFGASFSM
jgi:tyrosine phenol-lyase